MNDPEAVSSVTTFAVLKVPREFLRITILSVVLTSTIVPLAPVTACVQVFPSVNVPVIDPEYLSL